MPLLGRLFKIPRELADALWRTLLAERAASTLISPPPRVRKATPPPPLRDPKPAGPDLVAELLTLLRGHGGFRTAEELAADARRHGLVQLRADDVRELLKQRGASRVEVRLRDQAGCKVAEFRARPNA